MQRLQRWQLWGDRCTNASHVQRPLHARLLLPIRVRKRHRFRLPGWIALCVGLRSAQPLPKRRVWRRDRPSYIAVLCILPRGVLLSRSVPAWRPP